MRWPGGRNGEKKSGLLCREKCNGQPWARISFYAGYAGTVQRPLSAPRAGQAIGERCALAEGGVVYAEDGMSKATGVGQLTGEPPPSDYGLDAFATRYNEYFPKVFGYLYGRLEDKEVAQDLAAEVFERAFSRSMDLRSEEAFGAWVFTIARNVVASYWRRQKPAARALRDISWQMELASASPEESLLEREQITIILDLVRRLPQRERELLALKFDAELSNDSIAQVMGLSAVNVRVILHRTLRKLRDQMRSA